MVFCIGLTGTIASGKSTAARFFRQQGIEIINADDYARALVLPGESAFNEIRTYFGADILTENGTLDRKKLRQLILRDASAKAWLEACLHPRIREKIKNSIKTIKSKYGVIEIPLLLNKTAYPYLNRVLLIEAPFEQQVKRLIARDHCSEEEAILFLKAQPYQALHRELADDIIVNDSSLLDLEQKLFHMHALYLKYASNITER